MSKATDNLLGVIEEKAKKKEKKPTAKQSKAIKKYMENNGNMGKAMLESGYAPNSAKNPKMLTSSVAFKQIVERIPYEEILDNVVDIARSREDKRAALMACDMAFKLGGKYPLKSSLAAGLFERLNELED